MLHPPFNAYGHVAIAALPITLGTSPTSCAPSPPGGGGALSGPPLLGYPPLPPGGAMPIMAVQATGKWFNARRRKQVCPPKAAPCSPFAGWSPSKALAFPYSAKGADSEAAACVLELVQLGAGLRATLSPQLESDLGLDPFNYEIRRRPPPCARMRSNLKAALVHWALSWPDALLFHLFHESVGSVLGGAFPWAVFGEAKTQWRRRDRVPW